MAFLCALFGMGSELVSWGVAVSRGGCRAHLRPSWPSVVDSGRRISSLLSGSASLNLFSPVFASFFSPAVRQHGIASEPFSVLFGERYVVYLPFVSSSRNS